MALERTIEKPLGLGADEASRHLLPSERIAFRGAMEQERNQQKALGVQTRQVTEQSLVTAKI